MNAPRPRDADHQPFEELAVGYALGALEPEEEERAEAHLSYCRPCARVVDATREVAGDMAHAVPQEDPPAALWESLRAQLPADAFTASGPPVVVHHARRASDRQQSVPAARSRAGRAPFARSLVGAAAALSMVLALGAWNLSLRDGGGQVTRLADDRAAVLRLMEESETVRVTLSSSGAAQGVAVLADGEVWLVMDGLGSNDTDSSTFVLWSTNRTGRVSPVAPFDLNGEATQVVRLGALGLDPADLTGFAVTLEQGRVAPAAPGSPTVVTGTVTLA